LPQRILPMSLATEFSPTSPLALVGAGKMGGALIAGWLDNGLDPKAVTVFDPSPPEDSLAFLKRAGVAVVAAPDSGPQAAVIVVAVKPQIIKAVLPTLRPLIGGKTIGVSIAAGTTLATLEGGLGPIALVRAMPNTPAQVGRGITAAVANRQVGVPGKALVGSLLDAVGATVWLDDEALIDAVTAVSGSGPAYVFLLAECLEAAAIEAGLPPAVAAQLARATVAGAGELLHRSELPAGQLRKNVTSPNGTTAAALDVLMGEGGLRPLMIKAVAAAAKRSRELSG
jgi:pyrroline-5-carboxylate reductase